MIDLNKPKKKHKNLFVSWILIVILVLLMIFFIKQIIEFNQKKQDSKEKRISSEFEYQELQERKENLLKDIEKLESRVGQEEELRNRYSSIKEGEKLVVLVKEETENFNTQKAEAEPGLWGFFKGLFGF